MVCELVFGFRSRFGRWEPVDNRQRPLSATACQNGPKRLSRHPAGRETEDGGVGVLLYKGAPTIRRLACPWAHNLYRLEVPFTPYGPQVAGVMSRERVAAIS